MPKYVFLLALILAPHVAAEELQIVLWNGEQLFDVDHVNARSADFQAFGADFPDADIVILDEVTSIDVVKAAHDKTGYARSHASCSDFTQNDNNTFNSLEVGIISRLPLANIVEFDPVPDNTGQPDAPPKSITAGARHHVQKHVAVDIVADRLGMAVHKR